MYAWNRYPLDADRQWLNCHRWVVSVWGAKHRALRTYMYTTRARNNKWSLVVEIGLRTRTISLFDHKYALKRLFYKKKFNIYIFLHPETSIMPSRRSQSQLLLHPLPFDCCSALMAAPRVRDGSRYARARAWGLQQTTHQQQLIKLLRDLDTGCKLSRATHAGPHAQAI